MHFRMARGRFLGLSLFVLGLIGAAPAMAAVNPSPVSRAFTVRYAINTNGDIAQAANTLMTCQPGTIETVTLAGCAAAQAGAKGDDNYFDMVYADVDGDPATFNSSSANLAVPAGSTVLFAGLYWGAAIDAGETLPLQCNGGAATGHAAFAPAAAASRPHAASRAAATSPSRRGCSTPTPRISAARRPASRSARATRRSPT